MALTKVTGDMTSGIADESGLASVQTFTSSGTWTKPSGITKVIVEVQGAGASGSSVNYAGSGGGGGYAKKLLDVSSISTATITVGSGGAVVSSGNGGNAGGNSVWADGTNTVTGNGGSGAGTGTYGIGTGGTGVGGDVNIQGRDGGTSFHAGFSVLGFGGCFQSGGVPNTTSIKGYGGGGMGGWSSYNGGIGASGIVIVTEYK